MHESSCWSRATSKVECLSLYYLLLISWRSEWTLYILGMIIHSSKNICIAMARAVLYVRDMVMDNIDWICKARPVSEYDSLLKIIYKEQWDLIYVFGQKFFPVKGATWRKNRNCLADKTTKTMLTVSWFYFNLSCKRK